MRRQELIIFIAVIILVTVIFFGYVIFSLFSEQPNPIPSSKPTTRPNNNQTRPFPIPSPTPLLLPSISPGLTKDELINQLPLQTPTFNVEYYSQDDLFKVSIKEDPYEENKKAAQDWFKNLGFDPEKLNIYWFAFPGIQR